MDSFERAATPLAKSSNAGSTSMVVRIHAPCHMMVIIETLLLDAVFFMTRFQGMPLLCLMVV